MTERPQNDVYEKQGPRVVVSKEVCKDIAHPPARGVWEETGKRLEEKEERLRDDSGREVAL